MDFTKFVSNNFMQAPLAGYTDVGFRFLCAKYGCGLVVTEMVSAMSLKQKNKVAFDMLGIEMPNDSNCKTAVQLFGHDADVFAEVVKYDEIAKFDVIDINMGCPVPKVVKNGEGSALMRDLPRAAKIIEAVVKNSQKPVTVKFRKGFTDNDINAVEFAKTCENSGAAAITIHGRTREQMYTGFADRQIIKRVAQEVNIPVYANGDVKSADDAASMLDETNAFGVAIGRGTLGKPWLYAQLTGKKVDVDVWQDIKTHYEIMLKYLPEKVVGGEMKKHVATYLKGRRGAKPFINKLFAVGGVGEQLKLLEEFFAES